ncbi:hypothetical protein PC116_g32017 [Phytophthora cactorum]|nr:hypothetical protein PC116_g32017 [Phytophthora cactorum]
MTAVEKKLAEEDDEEVAQLMVDAISISVNPDSESSVACYRQLLPVPQSEDDEEPELDQQENAIKMALVDHAIMIKRCLASFARSSNPVLLKGYEDSYKRKSSILVLLL